MTQEEKQLLLQDLCGRLPYELIGEYSWKGKKPYNRELTGNLYDELKYSWSSTEDSKFLPYLHPMSSMTDEENEEYIKRNLYGFHWDFVDWCNSKHLDYRGFINKGLAIAVTEENNPYK